MAFPAGCEGLRSRNVTVRSKSPSRGGPRQRLGRQVLRRALSSEKARLHFDFAECHTRLGRQPGRFKKKKNFVLIQPSRPPERVYGRN